jgi:hypothetical protein
LFDAAIVESGRGRCLVLGVHLGEVTTLSQSSSEYTLKHILFDHHASLRQ